MPTIALPTVRPVEANEYVKYVKPQTPRAIPDTTGMSARSTSTGSTVETTYSKTAAPNANEVVTMKMSMM